MITPEQAQKIIDLGRCRFLPGSYEKRFVGDIQAQYSNHGEKLTLTEKQAAFLDKTHQHYCKQIRAHEARGWQTWFTIYGKEPP